jgi:hypothetical protein
MYVVDRSGRISMPIDKARHMREGYLRHRLLEWQEPVDDATLACLTRLGYTGESHEMLSSD